MSLTQIKIRKHPTRLKETDITRLQRPRAGVGERIVKIYACLFIVSWRVWCIFPLSVDPSPDGVSYEYGRMACALD